MLQHITTPHERELEAHVKQLEAYIHELEENAGLINRSHFDPELKLLAKEEKLLLLVMSTDRLTREVAHAALYSDRLAETRPKINILSVYMAKIRQKIEPTGVKIETIWGTGWSMTKADRDHLRKFVRHVDD
jgi:DNA-binding response OmpR family regulator